jgi:PAS domain S-box-containing protein
MRLGTKVMLAIGLVSAIAIASIFFWIAEKQEEQIIREIDKQAKVLFKQIVITRSWIADHGGVYVEKVPGVESNPYLKNPDIKAGDIVLTKRNPALVTRELSEYAEREGLYKFHITSLDLVNPSNAPDEFERKALHEFEMGKKEASRIEVINGSRVYRYMAPLYVEEACLQCHGHQGYKVGDIRGGISVFLPMDDAYKALASTRKFLFFSAVGIIVLLESILYLLVKNIVLSPVSRLKEATAQIAQGNYDTRIKVDTKDEFGELARSFNKMAQELKESYAHLEQKVRDRTAEIRRSARELKLLQKINNLLNSGATLEEILDAITEGLTSVYGYDCAAIYLLDEGGEYLTCKSYSADSKVARKIEEMTGLKAVEYKAPLYDGSLFRRIIDTKKPIITEDIVEVVKSNTDDKRIWKLAPAIAKLSGIKSGIGVPLLAGDKVVGVIGIGSKGKLSPKDSKKLANFGSQAGLAVEKARLEQKLREYSEQLEQKVEERTRALKESEERFRSLVENVNEAIFSLDLNGKILSWNKAAEEIYGWSEEEILQKDVGILCADGEKSRDCIVSAIETGRYDGELEGKRKNGEVFPAFISVRQLLDDKGNLRALVGVVRDITDQKEREKLERQLLQSDKLATIGQLAAGVAHEINNPLANISLYAQMLSEEIKAGKPDIKKLEIIEEQVDVAAKIVNSLLEFSRQREPEISHINVNREITKVLDIIGHQFAGIEVIRDFDPDLPEISADPTQIQQVFINIITNAIQAMPNGGRIVISTKKKEDKVEIKISDTGVGIPKEHLSKIFDPFFTTKEIGRGTGLGLSICYGIIERHNGTISVESEVGKGTTVTVELPL